MIRELPAYPHLKYICITAVIARIGFAIVFADFHTGYYWEYGEIGKNILSGRGYSYYYLQDDVLRHRVSETTTPFPSAYMPPGYVAYLLPFLTIRENLERNILIILSHIIVSLMTVVALYVLAERNFSENVAVLSGYIFAVVPDFLYAVVSFTPTILFHCGVVCIMLLLYSKRSSAASFLILGVMISLLIYVRSEFILFVVMLAGLFAYRREWKKLIFVSSVVILLMVPWSVRNYQVFHSFVPFTTSGGLNLYRGNNADQIGAWGNPATNERVKSLARTERFELELNALFYDAAVEYIGTHPLAVAKDIPVKLFDLWIFDRHSERNNWYYTVYSVLFSVLFFIGLFRSASVRHVHVYIFFMYFSLVVALFFCLPRYQTMMRIAMVPFAAVGIEYVVSLVTKRTALF